MRNLISCFLDSLDVVFCGIPSDDDSELDSLVGESCLTDFSSNISDEDCSSVGE